MYILVDDTRDLNADVILRHSNAADAVLPRLNLRFDTVLLDHDLGEWSERDGYYVLMEHIVNRENERRPLFVELVSSNPVGRERMRQALLHDAGYVELVLFRFKRQD